MTHSISVDWDTEQVAVISFQDPERQNQVCWAAIWELAHTLTACREQGARVVVLASSLPGHWLEHAWLRDLDNTVGEEETTAPPGGWFQVLDELAHPEMISIAAISGDCSGGGAELGWACDFRIAEQQARFAQPEINISLTTGIGGCSRLARLAGRTLTNEMVLLGTAVSAQRLYQLGALNRLVPSGQALSVALEWGWQVAAKSAPALAALKSILNANEVLPLDKALQFEQETFVTVVATDTARAGMQSAQAQYDEGLSIAQLNRYDD